MKENSLHPSGLNNQEECYSENAIHLVSLTKYPKGFIITEEQFINEIIYYKRRIRKLHKLINFVNLVNNLIF